MSIKKIKSETEGNRWEVNLRIDGRGSKRLRRRFDRRSDAEAFVLEFKKKKLEMKNADAGIRNFEATTFREESQY
jgi:hypothetical protein